MHLDDFNTYDVWCDDRHNACRPLGAGAIHINDMRQEWCADIRSPFHVMNFYIPQAALDEITDEQGAPRLQELNCPMSLGHVDSVFRNLALAFLPALARPDQTNRLFAEHASQAMTAHLARSYGSVPFRAPGGQGGLAPWQERRAKELLSADLSGNIGLSELANACRLSSSHFSQAFKKAVGSPPHQWLLAQRVERAKQLLLNTDQSLCEIALATGFADQSHFTRVFSQRTKASPAAWRRAQAR
jgi:AraC-like DNA-binding protein